MTGRALVIGISALVAVGMGAVTAAIDYQQAISTRSVVALFDDPHGAFASAA